MRNACLLTLALACACGKTANRAVCCATPPDCAAIGVEADSRECAVGLACIDNLCVDEDCERQGCEAKTPVCNIVSDRCEGCTDSADCTNFASEMLCEPTSGACVQCLTHDDCGGSTPVCTSRSCQKCAFDFECASSACADDGACVAQSNIVYLDPAGADAGECTRQAPCRTIVYAVSKTTNARNHIVMAKAAYTMPFDTQITPQSTSATKLFLHGRGSSLTEATGDLTVLRISIPITIRDLEIYGSSALAIGSVTGTSLLERVVLRSGGFWVLSLGDGTTVVRDSIVDGAGTAMDGVLAANNSSLVAERTTITRARRCVYANSTEGSQINMINVLVHGCTERALHIGTAQGLIEFTTIANSGTDTGTGPRAVACGPYMTVRSSIIWAPGTTARAAIEGCNVVSTIAGPTPVAGASSADPRFYDNTTDFHLRPDSPARDLVDTGPTIDAEGLKRPQGPRFDIGALEGAP